MEFKGKYLSARKKLIESLAYKKFSKVHGKCLLGKKSEFQSSYCIYNSMEKHYIVYIYISGSHFTVHHFTLGILNNFCLTL